MDFTTDALHITHVASALAKENSQPCFAAGHLLKALLTQSELVKTTLNISGEDIYYLEEWADVRIESYPKGKLTADPTGDESVLQVFTEAENIADKYNQEKANELCLLASLVTPGVGFSYEQLKSVSLTRSVIESFIEGKTNAGSNQSAGKLTLSPGKAGKALQKYCTDLVLQAHNRLLSTFIGRHQELISIIEIIGRKSKPNVILTGDPGVGKTAIASGLAQLIAEGKATGRLANAVLFELDFNALMTGASYKGEVEDRFRSITTELEQFENAILFIDDFHNLLDKNQPLTGIINTLRHCLSKKSFILIATTLTDEYRKKLEPLPSLTRWCEVMAINEPSKEEVKTILRGVMADYETHHQMTVPDSTLDETIRLSVRFLKERLLPDSAIDLLDRTMAALSLMYQVGPSVGARSQMEWEELKKSKADSSALIHLFQQTIRQLNYLTLEYLDISDVNEMDQSSIDPLLVESTLKKLLQLADEKEIIVTPQHIAATVSKLSGIPAGKIASSERERLMTMEDSLKSKVIGQDQAIQSLTDAILESRSGLSKPGLPIGSFFLLGPTGTGKTELAKQLADFLFQTNQALIRFDMSEFKEEHSAALLYGAPPGYVGYEEGGMLVNKIRQQPYSVVLFDEIEKAHPSVFDIFLQILDEGKIHDKLGKTGDFSNAVILFTSNIGSQFIVNQYQDKGTLPERNELLDVMTRHFRPEFLGRLTGIVPFAPIEKVNVVKILKLMLKELEMALQSQHIVLDIDNESLDLIASEGYTPEYGARPLRSVVRDRLKTPLSRLIISGKLQPGSVAEVRPDNHQELIIKCHHTETTKV